jgi:hypothetical protein
LGEEGDFVWAVPGELVHSPTVICDCPECGCERSMVGFVSHRATTCFRVQDLDLDRDAYLQLLWSSLLDGGWVTMGSAEDEAWVEEEADDLLGLAARLPEGKTFRVGFRRAASDTG